MKLIITGGRDYSNYEKVCQALDEVERQFSGKIIAIVQGGAKGADALGKRWAMEKGYPIEQFDAEWNKYGKTAGFIRNQEMLDESNPCLVVAFPGGSGTYDMIKRTNRCKHADLIVIRDEEDELDREG